MNHIPVYYYHELSEIAKVRAREEMFEVINRYAVERVHEFFRRELEKLHYPTEDIRWSLSYCKGDGVAFYGSMDTEETLSVAKRVLRSVEYRYLSMLAQVASIRTRIDKVLGEPHNHAQTMHVEVVCLEPIRPGYTKISRLLETIRREFQTDVQMISRRLQKEGYKILASTDFRKYLSSLEFTQEGRLVTVLC